MATRRSITTQLVAIVALLVGLLAAPARPAAAQTVPPGQCVARSSTLGSGLVRVELQANQFMSSSGCVTTFEIGAATLAGWGANQYAVYDVGYPGQLVGYMAINGSIPNSDYGARPASFSATSSAATLGGELELRLVPATPTDAPWSGTVYVLYRPFPGAPGGGDNCVYGVVVPNQNGPALSLLGGSYRVLAFWTEGKPGQAGNPYLSVNVGGSSIASAASDATTPQGWNLTIGATSGALRVNSGYISSPVGVQFCREIDPTATATATPAATATPPGCDAVSLAPGQQYTFHPSSRFNVFFDGPPDSEGSLYYGPGATVTIEKTRFHNPPAQVLNNPAGGTYLLTSGRNTMQYRICYIPDVIIEAGTLTGCISIDIYAYGQRTIVNIASGQYDVKNTGQIGASPIGLYRFVSDNEIYAIDTISPQSQIRVTVTDALLFDIGAATTPTTATICAVALITPTATVAGGTAVATATATATATARPAITATGSTTRTPSATRTATSSATATATRTATVTGTPPIAADCPASSTYVVPVAPANVVLTLRVGMRFYVADAVIYINIGAEARQVPPGAYRWNVGDSDFTAYSLTTPGRVLICDIEAITATVTSAPAGAGPDIGVCVAVVPTPQDVSGPGPNLDFSVPTLAPLPVLITATVTISVSGFISGSLQIATAVAGPAVKFGAWTDSQFGPDGWEKGTADAAPLVAMVAGAFGWLAFFSMLGQLNWVLPPVLLSLLVRLVRALLSIVKWVKQILPFQ